MSDIENYLVKFLAEGRYKSLNRLYMDILADALLHLHLKRRSLTLPMEDLERCLVVFNQKLEEVEHQHQLAQDVLKGDKERSIETLDQECTKIIREAKSRLSPIIEDNLAIACGIQIYG